MLALEPNLEERSVATVADLLRIDATGKLNTKRRTELGQFFTPVEVSRFMADLFSFNGERVCLLDAGAGVGSLTAAFVDAACAQDAPPLCVDVTAYEVDDALLPHLTDTLERCQHLCADHEIDFHYEIKRQDFVDAAAQMIQPSLFSETPRTFTHAILNPPYRKIHSASAHRRTLRAVGIEANNLYTAFLALAASVLSSDGQMVAITPRSFCNGPYFRPFRSYFLRQMSFTRIHLFEERDRAFGEDNVLQENAVFHAVKTATQRPITLSASGLGTDNSWMTLRVADATQVIDPSDPNLFIHLSMNDIDRLVVDRICLFEHSLEDIGIEVSTGRVVDFRARQHLRAMPDADTVPLIYPTHFQGYRISWPKADSKKPNALASSVETESLLLPTGHYVLTRRFSSKEERRRIVAALFSPDSVSSDRVGFENHLNVFHRANEGLSPDVARGLLLYLNSTLVDMYFRNFSGHTQVNATDLRTLPYPGIAALERLGANVGYEELSQKVIDDILAEEIERMAGTTQPDPSAIVAKTAEAMDILTRVGMPKGQQNERSALTLLALIGLRPEQPWSDAGNPLMGITPMMDFIRDHYGKNYAPNTRETIRRQTMHQFVEAGLARQNPDDPDRPTNSPHWCYQIESSALDLLQAYGTPTWEESLTDYLGQVQSLRERYADQRKMQMLPVKLQDGSEIELTPGSHNQLVKAIIEEFAPRFVPGSTVIYVGDTDEKWKYFDDDSLTALGISIDPHGKMPDVVVYDETREWLLLIESVTSHGPVDGKRKDELRRLFGASNAGLVYVTAFLTRADLAKYLGEISWETEVWVADSPTHLIHFDGERFLGPYNGT